MTYFHTQIMRQALAVQFVLLGVLLAFFVFAPMAHAATASVTIVPTQAYRGDAYTVSWTSSGATSCSISGPGLAASTLSGSQSVTQTTLGTKTYTITCSTGGSCTWVSAGTGDFSCFATRTECTAGAACTTPGASCNNTRVSNLSGEPICTQDNLYTCSGTCSPVSGTDSINVVNPPAPTVTVSASPATVAYGSPTTISWSSTYATSCFESSGTIVTGGAISGSAPVTPSMNTTYTFNCTGYGGTGSGSGSVTVTGVPAPSVSLVASPTTVTLGGASTLTWSTTNATTCTGTGFATGGNPSGSANVTPATNTTYSIDCTGQGGTSSASAGVGVTGGGAAEVIVFDNNDGWMHVYVDPDALANGGIPDATASSGGIYAGGALERNRACYLVDPTSYPTAWSTRSYNSPSNNYVLKFNGTSWYTVGASGSNTKYSWLTCKTNQKPDVSLTGNGVAANATITVAAGSAVNLTWLSQYGQVRQGTCSAQNFTTDTWIPGHYETSWQCDPSCGGGTQCVYAPVNKVASRVLQLFGIAPKVANAAGSGGSCIKTQTWVDGTNAPSPFGGSTTVNPMVTTTYTYTCANAIGSTSKTITVTVPTGPQCSDGLDNDSDGLIDLADPGCMSGTDTTEDPNPPPPPTLSSPACAANGTSVSLDWNDTSVNGYYLRISRPGTSSCPSGWVVAGWDANTCIPNPDLVNSSNYNNYPVTPGTAYSYWVHSRTATGEWSAASGGSFTCTPSVPLTASCSVSPSTATTGQNVTWTATASGGTGTYTSYTWSGSAPLSGTGNPKTLVGGYSTTGAKTGSVTVLDSSGASYTVADCNADATPGDGVVTVNPPTPQCSDGLDNDGDGYTDFSGADPSCTDGTDVTEGPVSPKVTSFSCTNPSPCIINPGGTATLSWGSSNATSCTLSGVGAVGANATQGVTPASTQSYSLVCTGNSENSTTQFVTVTVRIPAVYVKATPARLTQGGGSTSIAWSATNVVGSCTMTKNNAAFNPVPLGGNLTPDAGGNIATSTIAQSVTGQTVYKITCGGLTSTAIVNVDGTPIEF